MSTERLTLNLDPVALREATTQAIMGLLTPDLRAELIRQAISRLLAPSTDSWNRGKSELEQAFDLAIVGVARDVVKNIVATDAAVLAQMKTLIEGAVQKMVSLDVDKMTERMADAFIHSLKTDR